MGEEPTRRWSLIYYSASELGSCPRAIWARRVGKVGTPPSQDTKDLWAIGHELEGEVLEWLHDEKGWGFKLQPVKPCRTHWETCDQEEVVLDVTGQVKVVAHLDALAAKWTKQPDWDTVVEVKSMGADGYEKFVKRGIEAGGWMEKYKWQTSVQGLATGMKVLLVGVNRDDPGQKHLVELEKPYYSKAEVAKRVLEVEVAARLGKMPGCDGSLFPCPFLFLHDGDGGKGRERIEDEELERLARKYKAMECVSKRLAEQVEGIKGELKNRIKGLPNKADGAGGAEGCKVQVGKVKISMWMQNNPPRLDKGKVEGLGLKVEDVTSQTRGERMRVEVEE